jgi:hypothetical protein
MLFLIAGTAMIFFSIGGYPGRKREGGLAHRDKTLFSEQSLAFR